MVYLHNTKYISEVFADVLCTVVALHSTNKES
jgi:hypothetical protein